MQSGRQKKKGPATNTWGGGGVALFKNSQTTVPRRAFLRGKTGGSERREQAHTRQGDHDYHGSRALCARMGDCNDHGAAGPCDPPTIVPDSLRVSVAAGPLFRDNDAAPLAACFVDQSSTLPLLVTNKPSHPAGRTDVEGRRSSMIPVVLPADAAKLDDDKGPNNRRTAQAETPHGPVAGLDPLQLLPLPEEGGSPELPLQPRPGSEQPPPGVASYSSAWQKLAREVGAAAAAATRPSLCACKKLAVAALLSVDGRDGSATQRPGRVCANRGKEVGAVSSAWSMIGDRMSVQQRKRPDVVVNPLSRSIRYDNAVLENVTTAVVLPTSPPLLYIHVLAGPPQHPRQLGTKLGTNVFVER